MARIALSDLHFSDGSKADDFGPADGLADWELMDKIDQWKRNGDRVVLAGDVFDLWQADYRSILAAHGPVIRALFELVDVYVAGNHDWDLVGHTIQGVRVLPHARVALGTGPLIRSGSCPPPHVPARTGRSGQDPQQPKGPVPSRQPPCVWIEHGHAHDPLISRFPRTSRVITWVAGWLERRVHRDVDLWGERLARWIGGTGRHGGNERYVPLVALRARAMGCQTAVFGHTHQWDYWMRRVSEEHVDVFNSGTWTNGKRDYVRLDG